MVIIDIHGRGYLHSVKKLLWNCYDIKTHIENTIIIGFITQTPQWMWICMTHALMKPKVVSPCCLPLCPPCATTSHHNHHNITSLHLNHHNQRISVRPTPKSNQILCLHHLWHSICCHKTLQIWIPHLRKWLNPRKQKRLCTLPTLSILPFVAKPIHLPHLMFNPFSMPRSLLNSLK